MLNQHEIMQTIQMIDQQHLDVRTITMGISLLSCAHSEVKAACDNIYDKITRYAEKLVTTGEAIEKEFGIPIVNKRISVTPIALVAAAARTDNYAPFAAALDRAATMLQQYDSSEYFRILPSPKIQDRKIHLRLFWLSYHFPGYSFSKYLRMTGWQNFLLHVPRYH